MINLRKTLTEVQSIFEKQGIAHALIGGFALATFGQHRATADINILVDGQKKDLIKQLLSSNGYVLKHESPEVLQFSGTGFVDILLANRPLSQKMLRSAIKNLELGVYVARPEDIVGLKIQAYKNDPSRELQDKAHIQKLLQLPQIDFSTIKKYADLFSEWPDIEKLRSIK